MQTPRSPSSKHHKKFRPRRHRNPFTIPLAIRSVRVALSNLSTQFRPTQTRHTGFLPLPVPRADRTRVADSEQISSPSTTHHTSVRKDKKPSAKSMSLNGKHIRTWWVRHLVSWTDLLLSHRCQRAFCP